MAKWEEAPVVSAQNTPRWMSAPEVGGTGRPADPTGISEPPVDTLPADNGGAGVQSNVPDAMLIARVGYPYTPGEQSPYERAGMSFGGSSMQAEPATKKRQQEWTDRASSFFELQKRGYDPAQINTAAKIYANARQPDALSVAGAALGSFASALVPGPDEAVTIPLLARMLYRGAQFGAGVAGAGAGAFTGSIADQALHGGPLSIEYGLKRAKQEMGWEAGSRLAVGGLALGFSPFAKNTYPEAAEVMQDFYDVVGGVLTPAQRDRRISIQAAEAISRSSFGGEQIFDAFGRLQRQKAAQFADEVIDKIATGVSRVGPEEMGEIVNTLVSRPEGLKWQAISEVVDPMYAKLDELTRGKMKRVMRPAAVETGLLDPTGRPITREVMRSVGQTTENAIVPTAPLRRFGVEQLQLDKRIHHLTADGRSRMQDMVKLPKELTFLEMRKKHSAMMRDVRKLTVDVDQAAGLVKKASGLAGQSIESPAVRKRLAEMAPEALPLYDNANAIYREASDQWETLFPQRLLNRLEQNPTNAVNAIFTLKRPEKAKAMKDFFTKGPRGTFQQGEIAVKQLKAAWLEQAIESATDAEGVISPSAFGKRLRKIGDETLSVWYDGPGELKRIKNIETLLQRIQPPEKGAASVFTKGIQIGGVGLVGSGITAGNGISVLAGGSLAISPVAFAKLATTKAGASLLSMGVTMPPGSKQLAVLASRMIRELAAQDQQEARAKARAQYQLDAQRKTRMERAQRNAGQFTPSQLSGFGGRGY